MIPLPSRLWSDVRSVWAWIAVLAVISFLASFVAYLMSAVAYEGSESGSLSLEPPMKPLSFVRVYDPKESFIQQTKSLADTSVSRSAPIQEMFKYATAHPETYFVMSLSALGGSLTNSSGDSIDGHLIIGRPPGLTTKMPKDHSALLFGSLPRDTVSSMRDRIGQLPVRQVSTHPLDMNVVDGQGYTDSLDDAPTVIVDTQDAALLGIQTPYQPADVAESMVCHCSPDQLNALASQMTSLQNGAAGPESSYIAVGYSNLIGPLQRAAAAGAAINQVFIAATLLSVVCFAFSSAHILCARRLNAFRGELLVGSPIGPIHTRLALLTTAALTLPLLAGGALSRLAISDSVSPSPLPIEGDVVYAVLVITLGAGMSLYSARLVRVTLSER